MDAAASKDDFFDVTEAEKKIKHNRNSLYNQGGTVLFSHILNPIMAHGSHLIYAPDQVALEVLGKAKKYACNKPEAPAAPKMKMGDRFMAVVKALLRNWLFVLFVLAGLAAYKVKGAALKCFFQDHFMGWAHKNATLPIWKRALSICAMMVARLVISNFLPFTSPAFAFLIARSQPVGTEWQGTFYLLLCSMPAGALVPFLDTLVYCIYGRCRVKNIKDEDDKIDQHFLVTNAASWMTDRLPFSFWVRPFFMVPAFLAAADGANFSHEHAASAAVVAGHFMIWSGPATTMYQRKFVPDWLTCIVIQPLGLFEDVAVVLATWAGASPLAQKKAEMSLYVFMLIMNLFRAFFEKRKKATSEKVQHYIVGFLTCVAIAIRFMLKAPEAFPTTTMAPSSTTTPPPLCEVDHTNVKVIAMTVAKVTAIAFACRIVACTITWILKKVSVIEAKEVQNTEVTQQLLA